MALPKEKGMIVNGCSRVLFSLCMTTVTSVWASCTGDTCQLGMESQGHIQITLHPDDLVRIWGLENMEMKQVMHGRYQGFQNLCAYSSNQVGRLSVTSSHNMHLLTVGGQGVAYRLSVQTNKNRSLWQELLPNHSVSLSLGNDIDPGMDCRGQANISLRALVLTPAGKPMPAGVYTDTVTMTVHAD